MSRMLMALTVAGAALLPFPHHADAVEWGEGVIEPAWDWHPGDLVFRNGVNPSDDRLAKAKGWKWASVGILRSSSAGPRVVFVDEKEGVIEVTLDGFVTNLSAEDYAVYRAERFVSTDDTGQMIQGPIARYSVLVAYGAAYDQHFMFGNGSYYNAELPFEAALSSGVMLGGTATIEQLAGGRDDLRKLFLTTMKEHPYCAVVMNQEECWDELQSISVVTTNTILASDALTRVFPQGR